MYTYFIKFSVNKPMYYYVCPYCVPSEKARLFESTMEIEKCEHEKGLFKSSKKCKAEKYKCKTKKVLKCRKCNDIFIPSKKFLKEQKRKIKDG